MRRSAAATSTEAYNDNGGDGDMITQIRALRPIPSETAERFKLLLATIDANPISEIAFSDFFRKWCSK